MNVRSQRPFSSFIANTDRCAPKWLQRHTPSDNLQARVRWFDTSRADRPTSENTKNKIRPASVDRYV
jgi:hypothetical protein